MAELTLRDSLVVDADVLFRQLDDEAVLLDLKSGTYFGLNDVGTRAWQLIVEHGALSRVLEIMLDEYEAERAVIENDLLELGRELVSRGLAAVQPPDAANVPTL
jgi:hypothetical protein